MIIYSQVCGGVFDFLSESFSWNMSIALDLLSD